MCKSEKENDERVNTRHIACETRIQNVTRSAGGDAFQ